MTACLPLILLFLFVLSGTTVLAWYEQLFVHKEISQRIYVSYILNECQMALFLYLHVFTFCFCQFLHFRHVINSVMTFSIAMFSLATSNFIQIT